MSVDLSHNRLAAMLDAPDQCVIATITAAPDETALKELHANADAVEIRADMWAPATTDAWQQLVRQLGSLPVLATLRLATEGGRCLSDAARRYRFSHLLSYADGVDVELVSEIFPQVSKLAHQRQRVVIASMHNFVTTPAVSVLEDQAKAAVRDDADYFKVATMAATENQYRLLAEFTHNNARELPLITVPMGVYGGAHRAELVSLGSRATYAHSGQEATAPGQPSLAQITEQRNRQ